MDWNDRRYGEAHADDYLRYLHSEAQRFADEERRGRPVEERPGAMYFTVYRRTGDHGHVFVYRLVSDAVEILHVFHTAQDWPRRLEQE